MAPVTRSQTARAVVWSDHDDSDDLDSQSHLHDDSSAASSQKAMSNTQSDGTFSDVPPVYVIDLSLPPAQRYVQVAKDFQLVIDDLPQLFDDCLQVAQLPSKPFHLLARMVFRKLHSSEQTEELRGISKVTGVPMYLLTAYNVLLDLFMGCTSGGMLVKDRRKRASRMMHFRTLDWGMEGLRKAIVQFEFKKSKNGPVIATAINFVGYVGMLTAVRKGLSMSLNFRPYHNNDDSRWANFRYRAHQLAVLLGFRPSISAILRDFFLPPDNGRAPPHWIPPKGTHVLPDIARHLPSVPTSAAYLVFSDGAKTLVLEKDRVSAKAIVSSSFITATNHDVSYEHSSNTKAAHIAHAKSTQVGLGMKELVAESVERKGCMSKKWEEQDKPFATLEQLRKWVNDYPITNEQTHFATIMDPTRGTIVWVKSFENEAHQECVWDEGVHVRCLDDDEYWDEAESDGS